MKETERILAEYQQASEEQRLGIYLAYREMRSTFDEIGLLQSDTASAPIGLSSYKMIRSWTIMLFSKRLTIMMESR